MPKRSFIEEELYRESRSRTKAQKRPINKLFHKEHEDTSSTTNKCSLIDFYNNIVANSLAFTPNETRAVYAYPTISDKPQQAGRIVMTKLESTNGEPVELPMFTVNKRGI